MVSLEERKVKAAENDTAVVNVARPSSSLPLLLRWKQGDAEALVGCNLDKGKFHLQPRLILTDLGPSCDTPNCIEPQEQSLEVADRELTLGSERITALAETSTCRRSKAALQKSVIVRGGESNDGVLRSTRELRPRPAKY